MTQRARSTFVSANARQISQREQVASQHAFVARAWDSGLATDFSNDLNRLIFMLARSTWASWADWAAAQVEQAHELNMHPPKLVMARETAPLWARPTVFSPIYIPALKISAGDFLLPLYAITRGNGEATDIAACENALELARD
jgi:hypothetical protein